MPSDYTPIRLQDCCALPIDEMHRGRPRSEKPCILLVTGYPAADATIPLHATEKKPLNEICSFFE